MLDVFAQVPKHVGFQSTRRSDRKTAAPVANSQAWELQGPRLRTLSGCNIALELRELPRRVEMKVIHENGFLPQPGAAGVN